MELFYSEINAFQELDVRLRLIYCSLLRDTPQFRGFFRYLGDSGLSEGDDIDQMIREMFYGAICDNADLAPISRNHPIELAYCLALISTNERYSMTPPWVHRNYPAVERVMKLLRSTPCEDGCPYCQRTLDAGARLHSIFGYDSFRTYGGEPLQETAVRAAIQQRSLLAIFPTGGGKSLTFQLPALIAGETSRGLTVVISPLQSLMKDQVDNLEKQGIVDAVTVNGLLSPVERADALERVANGLATILYLSPESLRSRTIERLLLSRNVVRFVVDEAHCFSAWGQDFRVDYLYICDFIREYCQKKNLMEMIPVSCFTATAKQKVISDIREHFKQKLGLELELYATSAARTNLQYQVLFKENEIEKYMELRSLIQLKQCPTIVYVSRTKTTEELASRLCCDGFSALPFHGRMDKREKVNHQELFIDNEAQIIVATSAFGMGVDKKDVGLVVHYEISDSLENYVQEAGRAGRDQSIQAECFVLFNDDDLDRHFSLLNQTKLSISEIQQVWKAIKDLTRHRSVIRRSPLEIARQAGWENSNSDVETRVKTAITALENAGYIERGKNMPQIYATALHAKSQIEASALIDSSSRMDEKQMETAKRITTMMIGNFNRAKAKKEDAESRVDYLSDRLGLTKAEVIESINLMREDGLLDDAQDMTAYIQSSDNQNKSATILRRYAQLEEFLLTLLREGGQCFQLKEVNELALDHGIKSSSVQSIKTILDFWTIKSYIQKNLDSPYHRTCLIPEISIETLKKKYGQRIELSEFLISYLYRKSDKTAGRKGAEEIAVSRDQKFVQFSLLELKKAYETAPKQLTLTSADFHSITLNDVQESLLYLNKIRALDLEGGFFVLYNAMEIRRLELDNKIRYKQEDYRQLNEYYKQKIQQVHIVGEYAHMMVQNYEEALQFVNDYFQMDYKLFLVKYFKGNRLGEINRNITPARYKRLFDGLSQTQLAIINDDSSRYIVVIAGPGSGKTKVLVHKLASLLLLEDVKHEQLLMVTFSRAAATEFKKRLVELIGNVAYYVEIKTFHSYCFDLLGKVGTLEGSKDIVSDAANMIRSGEVELDRITKTVLVIDEAQDMDVNEYALIEALMDRNDDMRVIAVGDDDQNIYEFRGSSSSYLKSFITERNAVKYEMPENYRSKKNIVALANDFSTSISDRMKSQPVMAVQQDNGIVRLQKYSSRNLEIPVVADIKQTWRSGTACVLTNTNDQALRVMGLLTKEGFHARLIQSNDGFSLLNLAEIRYFLKLLSKSENEKSPTISQVYWNQAIERLTANYSSSQCLGVCLNLIRKFAQTNREIYRTDLVEYIRESQYEDFFEETTGEILVSTIHKSKGREFDSVYMLMDQVQTFSDEEKRKIYVGLTRAKDTLSIHYNNGCFDGLQTPGMSRSIDPTHYPEPNEIMLQLSHRDVVLSYFKNKKAQILRLRSGQELTVRDEFLGTNSPSGHCPLLKFSKRFVEQMARLQAKGYSPYKAVIRFIVAWRGEDDDTESAVILPDLYLKK